MFKNTPYKKIFENGILTNPITKDNPYVQFSSKKTQPKQRKKNNRKGNGTLVTRIGTFSFLKYRLVKDKKQTHAILS